MPLPPNIPLNKGEEQKPRKPRNLHRFEPRNLSWATKAVQPIEVMNES